MDILSLLPQSLLSERLESVAYVYKRADAAVERFIKTSKVSCPFGCGSCCESFVPDILPVEALYLATFIAASDKASAYTLAASGMHARKRSDGRVGCPLYNDDSPYHCTVYEARPLVCRMFAFSAVRDKLGNPAFSVCRLGLSDSGIRFASGQKLVEAFGNEPPVMAYMGSELASIDPDSAGNRAPLPKALREAIIRVLFLVGMKDDGPIGTDPDLHPPLPHSA